MLANITQALRRGDYTAALSAAREAVAADPNDTGAQHLLGISLRHTGDLSGARRALERAIELAPEQSNLHFSLASLDLAEGKPGAAEQGLKHALALDPNQLGAYVTLVHLAMARRDLDEAERNLRLALRVNPNHPQVLVAQGYLAQARGDADLALRCFTAAAEADPTLREAQTALGKAFMSRELWPFAEKALSNALALDPTRPLATLRALAQARRKQGDSAGALQALDELISRAPTDGSARGVRAELLEGSGMHERALEDYLAILDEHPTHLVTLGNACRILFASDRLDEALARVEAALAKAPENDEIWKLRLNASGRLQEDAMQILQRWQAASPESAGALEMMASYHLTTGDLVQAEAWADRALAIRPQLYVSGLVKIQARLADDPAQALAIADAMLAQTPDENTDVQRALTGWAGMALDALGRFDEAAERWRRLVTLPANQLPPPHQVGAEFAAEGDGINGTLVWGPVGVRMEAVLGAMTTALGSRLRLNRLGTTAIGDGFGLVRWPPGDPEAGTAARWNEGVLATGHDPATVVDWIPHLDGYTLAALRGARVLALLTDPRDALLNWMVHGSVQQYVVAPEAAAAAGWLNASLEALADYRDANPDKVVLAHLDAGAAEAAQAIETMLGLAEPLASIQGNASRFPAGHWRKYADQFSAEFARLAPVAVRLGYPLA